MPRRLATGNRPLHRGYSTQPLPWSVSSALGFTLLELLVVLVIVVLAATAFPLVLDQVLPGHRVRAAAVHLEAVIGQAEVRSIARDRPQRVSIRELTSQFAGSTHLNATGAGGRPLRAVVVYPDGSTNGARFVVTDGSHERIVVVSAITGHIGIGGL